MVIATPDTIRADMAQKIVDLLDLTPGLSIKQRMNRLARELGIDARRLNDYRYGVINRPTADEWAIVTDGSRRIAAAVAAAEAVAAEIREMRNGRRSAANSLGRGAVLDRSSGADGGGRDRAGLRPVGEPDRPQAAGALSRFAGRILDCQKLPLDAACPAHRQLLQVVSGTAGEFTDGAAGACADSGLDRTCWLYAADAALPVRYVGAGIPIVDAEERERLVGRPVADQPLPPSFLSLVMAQLVELLPGRRRPTLHRITAAIGSSVHTYDRLGVHFDRSRLVGSFCVVGA